MKPEERMSRQDRRRVAVMGLFCANETLLNLMTDRDLGLELEQFSCHCSKLRHTEALQPLPQTALRSLLLVPGPVNWKHRVRNLPRFNTLLGMMHRSREGRAACTQGSGAGK